MPTIEISYKDLCNLIGKPIPLKTLQDGILYAKGEIEQVSGDVLKVEIKDTNRPDLWSCEGIARELKSRYLKPKFPHYEVKKSGFQVTVKPGTVQPMATAAIIRGLKINENVLSQMVQLQEKVAETFGRNRKEISLGAYDLAEIKFPVNYATKKPQEIKFKPLGFGEKLTAKEILEKHPKGKEFGHLLKSREYPVWMDAEDILSMPPVINSEDKGRVTFKTKDVFIECTGNDLRFLNTAINVLSVALADRGGRIESVQMVYPDKKITTPDLNPKKIRINNNYVRKHSGLKLSDKKITELLLKSNYKPSKGDLLYPAYRQDIMHQVDVLEDIIISYGYSNMEPETPEFISKGAVSTKEAFSRKIARIIAGTGLQEVMSYTLTNKNNLFKKMNAKGSAVEIENPISYNWSVFRNWLLPSVMEFLSANTHREFPQKIFEIGDCVIINPKKDTGTQDVRKLSAALTHSAMGYEDISSVLDALLSSLGLSYTLIPANHPSFIRGRAAEIVSGKEKLGIIGEINPQVLSNWKLENPVAAFEIGLDKML